MASGDTFVSAFEPAGPVACTWRHGWLKLPPRRGRGNEDNRNCCTIPLNGTIVATRVRIESKGRMASVAA